MTRPKLVVLRALGLGDLCTGVPSLRAVARAFPDHERLLAAPTWQLPIARQCGIDSIVAAGPLEPLPAELAGVDVAVNLHGRGPQSTRVLLQLRPGRVIAFGHPDLADSHAGPTWCAGEHEVLRWCRLLRSAGVEADPTDLTLETDPAIAPRSALGAVVVHPGAASPARRWPPARFAALIGELVDRGERVVLTGSGTERTLCGAVIDLACEGASHRRAAITRLAGETDLEQLCATIATAAAVVANDTGVAHLAAAYRRPSVTLFGPTSPAQWGPPPHARHRTLWKGRSGDPHASTLDPGLAAIEVCEVAAAVDEVLRAARSR